MANKVEFGISQLHIGTYTVADGVVTLGTPYHQAGAVSFSPEENSEQNTFYADNIAYWSGYSGGTIEGDLEVAMFDDAFKTQFLGYRALTDGGLANVKNATKPNVYVAFQVEGDAESRRVILYNCSLGAITREYATIEESKEPATETLPVTCTGDNATGVTMAVYKPSDTGYATLFSIGGEIMESIIKIGEKEVRVNNRAGWTITYRDQFGHDIVPTLMPLFAGALDVVSGLIKQTGKDNVEITDILAIADGDALINAFIHLSGFEFVEILNITWAMAKEADESIPEPKRSSQSMKLSLRWSSSHFRVWFPQKTWRG